jgi:GNAT superfamily N-acetyltransferase
MATIRRLEEADYDGWRPLWDGYLRFYRQELPEEVTRESFRRLCAREDGFRALIAVADEPGGAGALGIAHMVLHPSTWTTSAYCYLEDLFVSPAARGTTVARDLIEAVYSEADAAGAASVYWHTQEFNAPARSLYDKVAHRTSFVVYER